MTIIHEIIETGPLAVNCQLIGSDQSNEAILVDPGGDAEMLLQRLDSHGFKLTHVVNTHGHFDHVGGVYDLQQATGCEFMMHPEDSFLIEHAQEHAAFFGLPFGQLPTMNAPLYDGQILFFGEIKLEVIATPGHTPGGVCLKWDHHIATGDTLFAGSIGRTDLPGGNHQQLLQSIQQQLLPMANEIKCHPGHGPSTSIGDERQYNPYF